MITASQRNFLFLLGGGGVFILDQLSKWIILNLMNPPQVIPVTPFFNLVLVWNRGVSFGLLRAGSLWQTLLLAGMACLIVGILYLWSKKIKDGLSLWAISFIMGGAIGNVLDRVRYGAVVDFLDFYVGSWHWPAFNVADSGIVIGVGLLILQEFLGKHDAKKS